MGVWGTVKSPSGAVNHGGLLPGADAIWPFAEAPASVVRDLCGHYPLTFTGAPTWATTPLGAALRCNRNNFAAHATYPTPPRITLAVQLRIVALSDVTFHVLIRQTTGTTTYSATDGASLVTGVNAAGDVQFRVNATNCLWTGALVAGETYLIVGAFDGANLCLYINGILAVTQALSATVTANANGIAVPGQTGFDSTTVLDVLWAGVWPRALTGDEILRLRNDLYANAFRSRRQPGRLAAAAGAHLLASMLQHAG